MRFNILAAALAALLVSSFSSGPGLAQEAPAVSEQKLALAGELVDAADLKGSMRRVADVILDQFTQSFNSAAGSTDPDMVKFMKSLMQDEIGGIIRKVTPKLAEVYAETFTEQELKDILAFYRTPTGQKMVAKTPELSRRGQEMVRPFIPAMQVDMVGKIFDHMCEVNKCTQAQRKSMVAVEAQIIERIKAQAKAAVEPTT